MLERWHGQYSVWWKDIKELDDGTEHGQGWFSDAVKLNIGNEKNARFWQDKRCGTSKLMDIFLNLFDVAEDQFGTVEGAGDWSGNCWKWSPKWRRPLLESEQAEAVLMEETLLPICLDRDNDDRWIWMLDNSLLYKVKSLYAHLVNMSSEVENDECKRKVLIRLWRTAAPSQFFGVCVEDAYEWNANTG